MPAQLSPELQNRVVDLYQKGKTYAEITRETGVQGYLISKYVKKAGIPKRKSVSGTAAPAGTATAPSGTPVPSAPTAVPSTVTPSPASSGLGQFQPPPPPTPKPAVQTYQCDHCRALFKLDAGETLETAKCPQCGEKP